MESRIKNIRLKLEQQDLDGLIVSLPANITYLTNYESRDSYLLVSKKENIYFADSRYIEEAKKALKQNAAIKRINGSVFKLIADACLNLGLSLVGFEERYLPFAEYKKIGEGLGKKAKLIPTHSLIEELRQTKSPEELKKIKKAIEITKAAFRFLESIIKPDKKELEVVAELERFIRFKGATNSAFDIIVASGPNSSYPHHISGQRKIRDDEPVLVDMGVDYLGYKCDLTRVYFLGKIKILARNIYDIVLEAQGRAIKNIFPDKAIDAIDKAARQYITQKGFGKFFGHSLGHGVGLEVHESPSISSKVNGELLSGMVFTVEPAIYLPGQFGVRIEDMVLVTKNGCEVLSGAINK